MSELKFRIIQAKVFLTDNKWAVLLVIFTAFYMLSKIPHVSRCITVEVVGFTTVETNEGTQLLAIFESDGVKKRFGIPRKLAVQKGMVTIIQKENYWWNSFGYIYDEFSVCKN